MVDSNLQRVSSQTSEDLRPPEQDVQTRKSSLTSGMTYLKVRISSLFSKSNANGGVAQKADSLFKSADIHNGESGNVSHLSSKMQATAVRRNSEAPTTSDVAVTTVCSNTLNSQGGVKVSKSVKLVAECLDRGDKGDFNTVKKYLRGGSIKTLWFKPSGKDVLSLMSSLKQLSETRNPKSDAWKMMDKVMDRYDQISSVEMENRSSPLVRENLQVALFIEHDIGNIANNELQNIFRRTADLPRALALDDAGGVSILARKKCSKAYGEGTYKAVKSAVRVPLDDVGASAELVVSAKSKKYNRDEFGDKVAKNAGETIRDRDETLKEWEKIKKLSGIKGIIKGFGVCCYNRDGEGKAQKKGTAIQLQAFQGDLEKFDNSNGKPGLNTSEQVSVAKQLIGAVDGMHKRDVFNWDLKLANVLFRRDSSDNIKVAISDFGLAFDTEKVTSSVGTRVQKEQCPFGNSYGTPLFSPPELHYGETTTDVDGRIKTSKVTTDVEKCKQCEVWALGIMLYNLHFEKEFMDPFEYETSEDYDKVHNERVQKPLEELKSKQKELLSKGKSLEPKDEYELLIYNMLGRNQGDRISTEEAMSKIKTIEKRMVNGKDLK